MSEGRCKQPIKLSLHDYLFEGLFIMREGKSTLRGWRLTFTSDTPFGLRNTTECSKASVSVPSGTLKSQLSIVDVSRPENRTKAVRYQVWFSHRVSQREASNPRLDVAVAGTGTRMSCSTTSNLAISSLAWWIKDSLALTKQAGKGGNKAGGKLSADFICASE